MEVTICDVCGKSLESADKLPIRLVTVREFGGEPKPYVNVFLNIKVTYGCFSGENEHNPGHICNKCLKKMLIK